MNPNLLQITTIPIKIEIKVTNATYEYPDDRQPKVNISTKNGGYVMEAEPLKLKLTPMKRERALATGI